MTVRDDVANLIGKCHSRAEVLDALIHFMATVANVERKAHGTDPFKFLDTLNTMAADALTVRMMTQGRPWTTWDGTGTPPTGRIEVRLRGGHDDFPVTVEASDLDWSVAPGRLADITAWRPAE